jgi:hypothetical protein
MASTARTTRQIIGKCGHTIDDISRCGFCFIHHKENIKTHCRACCKIPVHETQVEQQRSASTKGDVLFNCLNCKIPLQLDGCCQSCKDSAGDMIFCGYCLNCKHGRKGSSHAGKQQPARGYPHNGAPCPHCGITSRIDGYGRCGCAENVKHQQHLASHKQTEKEEYCRGRCHLPFRLDCKKCTYPHKDAKNQPFMCGYCSTCCRAIHDAKHAKKEEKFSNAVTTALAEYTGGVLCADSMCSVPLARGTACTYPHKKHGQRVSCGFCKSCCHERNQASDDMTKLENQFLALSGLDGARKSGTHVPRGASSRRASQRTLRGNHSRHS